MRTFSNSILVRISRVSDIDKAELMDQWVKEYCKGEHKILAGPASDEVDVLFELEEEATLFKLRWI